MVRNYSEKGYQKINFSTVPICHQLPSAFLVALLTKYKFIWLCKRIPKEKRKGLWDKVSQESAYENAFSIGTQFRLDRISAFHKEKFIFKKYFITYIPRVSGMFHFLKLVGKFTSIIFPGRFFQNSPNSAMDPQSYLSAIAFPPIFYTFFPSLWPTGAGCSQMPVQGDPPQLWVFAQALGCSQSYLGLVKAEELRGAEHLTDSVKTAFLSLSLMKMSFRVPSHTQVCCSCLQKRKIL